jgi:excisionase family DNA binding protein
VAEHPKPGAKLVPVPVVAEQLSICPRTVQRMILAGDLRAVKIGRATRVTTESIEALIKRGGTHR